ncbi:hypothetical protein SFC88_19115 [Nocardioides sp. HM23]|uniref:hypothetical protein n=1 Tax=Nocardioides bizhenqiangii TaxID=3095076 RepID=UPI002ACAC9DB|nr:hypothetical protein [Nocardioides sp. HM23]MDZ5622959.1 hypothetical protein [Nocardioides sp. HM23]
MKTSARMTLVVVLAVLALVGTVPSGEAKGPTDVAVSGPGVDNVQVTYTGRPDDVDAGTLGDASRLYDMWSPALLGPAPDLSADELGPRYVLTWTAGPHGGEPAGGADVVVQHAYPFAEGGAWVEFPPDQMMWGSPIAAGWVDAPRLRRELVALGAVADVAQPALAEESPSVTASDASGQGPADQDDGWSSYRVAVPAGVLLAVAVVVGVIVARRRRLSR